MSIRAAFVEAFTEADAAAIEQAAREHRNGVHDEPGSDPFKWAITICVGHECLTRFREHHGITADADDVKAWVYEHGDLASHDGDIDYLCAFLGGYDGWVKAPAASDPEPQP